MSAYKILWRTAILLSLSFDLCAQTGTLTVKVRDVSSEEPVAQAEVTLATFGGGAQGQRGFTDKTGAVTLAGVPAGNYYLDVRAQRYLPSHESIDIPVGAMQAADVSLRPDKKLATSDRPGLAASAADLAAPKDARKQFDDGMKRIQTDPEEATRHFQKAIDLYPQFARAYAMLGAAQFQLKQLDAAEQSARKAIAIDPNFALAHMLLGKVEVQKEQYAQAEPELLEAIRLDPAGWEAPFQLARCYTSMRQYDKAMTYGLRAHQVKGSPATTHLLMVDIYSATHDTAGALRELEEFAIADPQSPYMAVVRKKMDALKRAQP
jgi:tetratricopeptide (TPR) repeat protein